MNKKLNYTINGQPIEFKDETPEQTVEMDWDTGNIEVVETKPILPYKKAKWINCTNNTEGAAKINWNGHLWEIEYPEQAEGHEINIRLE